MQFVRQKNFENPKKPVAFDNVKRALTRPNK